MTALKIKSLPGNRGIPEGSGRKKAQDFASFDAKEQLN